MVKPKLLSPTSSDVAHIHKSPGKRGMPRESGTQSWNRYAGAVGAGPVTQGRVLYQ